jgi:hypothetical protein
VVQLAKDGLCGERAGVESGRLGMQRELELAQPPASIAEAGSETLQGFALLGAR